MLFLGSDSAHGFEPWISDGTAAGTFMLKDTKVVGNSIFGSPVLCNGKVIFCGSSDAEGGELWITDGTTSGTNLLKDIAPGSASSLPQALTLYNGKVYFSASSNGATLHELWVTDGTTAGTVMISNTFTNPNDFVVFNNQLLFAASSSAGEELCISDGTTSGTHLLKDINPGFGNSYPTQLTIFNNKVYFVADDGVYGHELRVTDGTEAGTTLVKDINIGGNAYPGELIVYNNRLYFSADNYTNGNELWVSDGTEAGTTMVKDINTAIGASLKYPVNFCVYNGILFFGADDGSGREPWMSDGTASGTVRLKQLNPGKGSEASFFTNYNGRLYFIAKDMNDNDQLWATNGIADSTKALVPAAVNTKMPLVGSRLAVAGDKLFFAANYDSATGRELYSLNTPDFTSILSLPAITSMSLYPVPARENLTVEYTLQHAGKVSYSLYDMQGRCIKKWGSEYKDAGRQIHTFSISSLPSAAYTLKVSNNNNNNNAKVLTVIKQ